MEEDEEKEEEAERGQGDRKDDLLDDLEAQHDNRFAICNSSCRQGHATPRLAHCIAFC